jgi:hypothetical protein
MAERIKGDPRELKFYGEKAESIHRGYAITSLRNPNPNYAFERGERIMASCVDDGEKVPVVVIANETKKLSEHSIPVLALDGFFSSYHAVEGMRVYPGYENISADSPISAIIFIEETKFKELSKKARNELTTKLIEELLLKKDYRELFFPTMAFWVSEFGAFLDWVEFLFESDLINEEEVDAMSKYKYMGSETGRRKFTESSFMLRQLSLMPENKAFGPLILAKLSEK